MKKLEVLLSLDAGDYDTPKKLNRSEKRIPAAIVERIEAGEMTSEMLGELGRSFPVFRYKTCITVHGLFDLAAVPKIGGYKNLIQNQNGSLEIRYNAIDFERKRAIGRDARAIAEWQYWADSQGHTLQLTRPVPNREALDSIRAELQAKAERIRQLDFYGRISVYLARTLWGGIVAVLEVTLDAVPAASVDAFLPVLSGLTGPEIEARRREIEEREREQAEKWAADKAAADQESARRAAALQALRDRIARLPVYNFQTGETGIKAVTLNYGRAVGYKLARITGKGTFGRVKYEYAYCRDLSEAATAEFKPGRKEIKREELRDYRTLQGSPAVAR